MQIHRPQPAVSADVTEDERIMCVQSPIAMEFNREDHIEESIKQEQVASPIVQRSSSKTTACHLIKGGRHTTDNEPRREFGFLQLSHCMLINKKSRHRCSATKVLQLTTSMTIETNKLNK